MGRFVTRRLALGMITLLILSVLVFFGAQVLPGDVARRILGPFADQSSVDALNKELGTDQPLITQYWEWLSSAATGDFGESTATQRPVSEVIRTGFENSVKLAV